MTVAVLQDLCRCVGSLANSLAVAGGGVFLLLSGVALVIFAARTYPKEGDK